MRILGTLFAIIASAVTCAAATTWPASTNANQTFFGANSFSQPITLLSGTASTVLTLNGSKATASFANGTGAFTNNGAGLFGWFNDFASHTDLNNASNSILSQMTNTVNSTSNALVNLINANSNGIVSFPKTVFVATNGNDSTAVRGRVDLPSLTLSNALTLAQRGDMVFMFNGVYTATNRHNISNSITLKGQSTEGVVLLPGTTGTIPLTLAGDCSVESLSVIMTNNTGIPIDVVPVGTATNITIRNVIMKGQWDNLVADPGGAVLNFLAEDCLFYSGFDCLNLAGNTTNFFTFKNCLFNATRGYYVSVGTQRCARMQVGGTGRFLNCDFTVNGLGGSEAYNFSIDGAAVYVSNCGMTASSDGTVAKLQLVTGSILFDGCDISTNNVIKTGGTLSFTPSTYVGQFVGDGGGLTNLPLNTLSNSILSQVTNSINTVSNNIIAQVATNSIFTNTTVLVQQIDYLTNLATMAPDFAKGYQAITTNASFTFLAPLHVDSTKTRVQTSVVRVDNSTASPLVVTPPANVCVISNSYMGVGASGTTWFTFLYYPPDKTNVYSAAETH